MHHEVEIGKNAKISRYEIRKKNQGVEKDSDTDKGSITVSLTAANDVRSLGVSDG